MLRLHNIKKDYVVADTTVHALRGVDVAFRQSEFVSILGPSGCGKTTLLNIIGGLDHATDGELFINGVSTRNYSDRDWDTYRNHSIGFVFQSYNLIPHQTISENVELALSISGADKAERVRRAHEALDKVGLAGQYNKKPNQLSGGQCQRVAIARAIVNEPEILLADEPTGALDTATSIQIMDLITEIAKERLVIMVTHNPEIADKYSTRIIRLLDGEVVDDTNVYDLAEAEKFVKEAQKENSVSDGTKEAADSEKSPKRPKAKKKSDKKSKLSFWGAFKLSARNLWSKLKRTLLVCLAGSIGIVGVASVLAVSSGVQNYIRSMQDDMLSGNPVTVSAESINLDAVMSAMDNMAVVDAVKPSIEDGYINVEKIIEYLVARGNDMTSMFYTNDISKEYVAYLDAMPKEYYSALVKVYGINMSNNLYTDFNMYDGNRTMSLSAANTLYSKMLSYTDYKQYAAYISMFTESFRVAPNSKEYIESQYDVLGGGKIATEANEIMIVVSDESSLTDLLLAQFGYYSQDDFMNLVDDAVKTDKDVNIKPSYKEKFSYEDLMGKKFTWYPNDTVFNTVKDGNQTMFTYNPEVKDGWNAGKELTITAVLRPKDNISYGCLRSGFYYTSALADEVLENSADSQIVNYLAENGKTGFRLELNNNTSMADLLGYPSFRYSFTMKDPSGENGFVTKNEVGYVGTVDTMTAMLGSMMGGGTSSVEYNLTVRHLGGVNIPSKISIYPLSFDDKDLVTDYLKKWNSDEAVTVTVNENGQQITKTLLKADRKEITHTDTLEIVINLINQFIDIVTIALVSFTALSLVVSTVMIAIITYVSVIERIKEIGVIRSLGGRKRDVSRLFNAETFIIGGISGIIGIAVTYGISGIINLILGNLFGIYTIAALPFTTALIMIAISIGLTLISGLIPASLAAKKDPVESLRTE